MHLAWVPRLLPDSFHINLLRLLVHLFLGRILVHWRCFVSRQLGILLLLAALFRSRFLNILLKSNRLVALAAELGHSDGDEAAKSHAKQVGERASEDTNENGDEDSEESAADEHVHAVVMAVVLVTVMLHVVRRATVSTRAEPVRWLAPECFLCHGVVMSMWALHTVWSLVAAWSSLAHVLEVLDAVSHDALPFAEQWPLLALLLLLICIYRSTLLGVERGDHQSTARVLEEVDDDGRRTHGG